MRALWINSLESNNAVPFDNQNKIPHCSWLTMKIDDGNIKQSNELRTFSYFNTFPNNKF